MKEIPVWKSTRRGGRGHHTLILVAHAQVDDEDYPRLAGFTWLAKRSSQGRTLYPESRTQRLKKEPQIVSKVQLT
jgi:hypothetical protein